MEEFLGTRDECLLPLPDSLDALDDYALTLEITGILSQTQVEEQPLQLVQPPQILTHQEDKAPPLVTDLPGINYSTAETKEESKKSSKALEALYNSFVPPSKSFFTEKEQQKQIEKEIFKRAVEEQVKREQEKVAARVLKDLEKERNGRGKSRKVNRVRHEETSPVSKQSPNPVLIDLEKIAQDVKADLDKRRVHFREIARVIAGIMQMLPPEQLEALSENIRGSHHTLHLEGGAVTATLVHPHGLGDLTIPGYRARSIASSIIDIMRSLSTNSDFSQSHH